MTQPMMYDFGLMQQLADDLTTYKTQLSGQQTLANTAQGAVDAAWGSESSANFTQKHKQLMHDLDDLITVLNHGITGVTDASTQQWSTDQKVKDTFFENA